MKSLSYLNNFCATFQISYLDERDASVIFDKNSPNDQVIVVNEGKDHIIPLGIDIMDIVQGETLNIEYTIDLTNLSGPDVVWTVPLGCSVVHTPGTKIWKLTGITTKEQWDIAKYPTIVSRYSGFGEFVYDADITYTPSGSKSWNVNLTLQEGLFLDSTFSMTSDAMVAKSSPIPLDTTVVLTANGKYVLRGGSNLSIDSSVTSTATDIFRSGSIPLSVNSTFSMSAKLATRGIISIAVNSSISMTGKLAIRVLNNILNVNTNMSTTYTWPLPIFETGNALLSSIAWLTINPLIKYHYIYSSGYNNNGQLGLGNTTNTNSLTQVGVSNWKTISAGYDHVLGLKYDGTLWAWGYNNNGQLGVNDTVRRLSPVQVGSDTNWSIISAGGQFSLAIKTNGTLWAWGGNVYGNLGLGDTTDRLLPTQVGTATNWSKISAGISHSLGIRGTSVYSCGNNISGQLGTGDTNNRTSFTQVSTTYTPLDVACGYDHSIALCSGNFVLSCGSNQFGQCGRDTAIPYTQFGTVGTAGNIHGYTSKISANAYYTIVTTTTGKIWQWGKNVNGTIYSYPSQVGSDTNWSKISAGYDHLLALKTNGTLWAWGINTYGQLGLGDNTTRTSFTQVGSNTDWDNISAGTYFSVIGI